MRHLLSKALVVLLFLLGHIGSMQAQEKLLTVSGVVRDYDTQDPLPSVNIRVLDTAKGTASNREGAFRILLPPGIHKLVLSHIGYRSDTLEINLENSNVERVILLKPSIISLPEVVVYGDQRSPAEEIILKAAVKKKEVLSQLRSYHFYAYTKTTFRVPRTKNEVSDTVLAGLLETQTEGFWQSPNNYKGIITARRQSANFSPAQNIFTVGRFPNFNDDVIVLGANSIIGPTAPNALEHYSFEMLDTVTIDDVAVYRLRMKPKSSLRPGFDGTISIADRSFLVMQVDVRGNEGMDLGPLKDLTIRQQFALFEDRFWLPVESRTSYTVELSFPPAPPVLWEQYSLLYQYAINPTIPTKLFDQYVVSALPTADRPDSTFWQRVDILPLTSEEVRAYERMDSIMAHTSLFARAVVSLTRLPERWKELNLTSFSDFFHFNRVEGAYLGAGIRAPDVVPTTSLTLRAGYGFADRAFRYSVGVEKYLTAERTVLIGGDVHRTLTFREAETVSRGLITLSALLDKDDPVDYYQAEGWSTFGRVRIAPNSHFEFRYINEYHNSVSKKTDFSSLRPSAQYRANPPIVDGKLRSAALSFSYDTRKYMDVGIFETVDVGQNSVLFTFDTEHSDSRAFNSDFDYTRYTAMLQLHHLTFASGSLDVFLKLGYSSGKLPPQRLFDLHAAVSGLSRLGVFKTLRVKEFAGDRVGMMMVEHNFGNLPFRAIGLPFVQSMDLILYAGSGWTEISRKAQIIQPVAVQSTRGVFHEVGFALGKVLTFFRLDFTWRLTHRGADNFNITLGSSFL
ncbi:MAG: DUF5686 family protein [Bacteroidota bacterium]